MPPATMTSADCATSASCARIIASIAEPHILLTVVQPVESGRPALIDACRAGAWPCPAGRTQPKIVLSTSSGRMPARSTAALIAAAPRSLAASGDKSPWKPPIGVRAAPTMTIGSLVMVIAFHAFGSGSHACATRRGRATSSPPQFGQRPCIASAHAAQNVHSWLQIRASRGGHRQRCLRIARTRVSSPATWDHFDSSNSSRPISIRRISDVPAPIS